MSTIKIPEVHLSRAVVQDVLAKDIVDRFKKPNLIVLNSENYNEYNFYNYIVSSELVTTDAYVDPKYVKFTSINECIDLIPMDVKKILKLNNILLAGGSILELLQNKYGYYKGHGFDYDMFIYGLNLTQANEKLNEIKNLINSMNYKDEDSGDRFIYGFVYNERSLTITKYGKKYIQIIFRLYKSKSEILHGFDLSISQIGFDGKDILTTRLGYFALIHRLNIFDHTRRSTTYEFRLRKYRNNKRIGICFPDCLFDFKIMLPSFLLEYKQNGMFSFDCVTGYVRYNCLRNQLENKKPLSFDAKIPLTYKEMLGDYENSNHSDFNKYTISKHNLKVFKNKQYHFLYYVPGNNYQISFHLGYYLKNALKYFENIKDCMKRNREGTNKNHYNYWPDYSTNSILLIFKQNNAFEASERIEFINKIKQNEIEIVENMINSKINYLMQVEKLMISKYFYDNFDVKDIKETPNNGTIMLDIMISNDKFINWKVKNPGSQLTGSFEPIWESAEKWYGSYYSPMPRNFTQENLFLLLLANKFDKKSLIGCLPKDVLHLIFMWI